MVLNSIKVFARLKREKRTPEKFFEISKGNIDELSFYTNACNPYGNTSKFRFHKVFDQDVSQDDVFLNVAKPVVNSVLHGFNGTVFAYGQTGSGKTYSITGSPKTYQDRGIIPRSIQDIFTHIEKVEDKPIIYISYMEIYNEICYDLLYTKESKHAIGLEELPRVIVLEDKKGEPQLRNLSILPVTTEEEAMKLLFLGDTNRTIAETPMNEYSSRSHCLFTIYVTYRGKGTMTRFSKLNLVDLAGSERVYKSQISGTILNEAKHINLSLHFLQQVILALSESKRVHIPYRNSIMTFILKDSLAGNCLTVMLATLAVTQANIQESLSTCKFAQRVSMIKTEPVINEIHDPQQEIEMLRNEILGLQKQLAIEKEKRGFNKLNDETMVEELTDIEKLRCKELVENFLEQSEEKSIKIEPNLAQIQYCFALLKNKIFLKSLAPNPLKINNNYCRTVNKDYINKAYSINNQFDGHMDQYTKLTQEIEYYTTQLNKTYERAKILANSIDECQKNILYIRSKLGRVHAKNFHQRILLTKELECQQNYYKRNIAELKEVKNETLHLQSKLEKIEVLEKNKRQESIYTEYSQKKVLNKNENQYDHGKFRENHCLDVCCSNKDIERYDNHVLEKSEVPINPRYKNYMCSKSYVEGCSSCQEFKHVKNETKNDCRKFFFYPRPTEETFACSCEDCIPENICCGQEKHNNFPKNPNHYEKEVSSLELLKNNTLTSCDHKNCKPQSSCYIKNNIEPKSIQYCEIANNPEEEYFPLKIKPSKVIEKKINVFHSGRFQLEHPQTQKIWKEDVIKPFTLETESLNDSFTIENDGFINFGVYSTPYGKLQHFLNNDNQPEKISAIKNSKCLDKVKYIDKNIFDNKDETVCDLNNVEVEKSHNKLESIFKITDSKEFREFMKTIPLTGDSSLDQEICAFYRDKYI